MPEYKNILKSLHKNMTIHQLWEYRNKLLYIKNRIYNYIVNKKLTDNALKNQPCDLRMPPWFIPDNLCCQKTALGKEYTSELVKQIKEENNDIYGLFAEHPRIKVKDDYKTLYCKPQNMGSWNRQIDAQKIYEENYKSEYPLSPLPLSREEIIKSANEYFETQRLITGERAWSIPGVEYNDTDIDFCEKCSIEKCDESQDEDSPDNVSSSIKCNDIRCKEICREKKYILEYMNQQVKERQILQKINVIDHIEHMRNQIDRIRGKDRNVKEVGDGWLDITGGK